MKTLIIFLCLLGFCAAHVTTEVLNSSTAFSSSTETYGNISTFLSKISDHQTTSQSNPKSPPIAPSTTPVTNKLFTENHLLLFAGGLILACTILLISTILLAWKVCQLSRRLKMLSGHSDLMIPTKIWTGESKANTDAKETTVLMSDLNQTRDEDGEGGNEAGTERKKEEKDTCENGVEQKEKSAKNGEVKETPAAATEDSSSPKEEGEKSQVDNSKSSATSKEKEEAKDGE